MAPNPRASTWFYCRYCKKGIHHFKLDVDAWHRPFGDRGSEQSVDVCISGVARLIAAYIPAISAEIQFWGRAFDSLVGFFRRPDCARRVTKI